MKKKVLTVLMTQALVASMLAGCSGSSSDNTNTTDNTNNTTENSGTTDTANNKIYGNENRTVWRWYKCHFLTVRFNSDLLEPRGSE